MTSTGFGSNPNLLMTNKKSAILIYSPSFLPMVGGLMNVVDLFSRVFSQLGHEVTVVTFTLSDEQDDFPYNVVRKPSFRTAFRLMRNADICIQFNVSLIGLPLWILSGQPLIISHHSLNDRSWRGKIKDWIANKISRKNICCSNYIAKHYEKSILVSNPFDNRLFRIKNDWSTRQKDLLFVGRLVSDKGTDLFVDAVSVLVKEGYFLSATIVGDGPEKPLLMEQANRLDVKEYIHFAGTQTGDSLVDIMNAHKFMVVPSKWEEPFGIVALEGIACGCIVVGSSGGGLGEAIGCAGLTFKNGDLESLLEQLRMLFVDSLLCETLLSQGKGHIERHNPLALGEEFIRVIQQISD